MFACYMSNTQNTFDFSKTAKDNVKLCLTGKYVYNSIKNKRNVQEKTTKNVQTHTQKTAKHHWEKLKVTQLNK